MHFLAIAARSRTLGDALVPEDGKRQVVHVQHVHELISRVKIRGVVCARAFRRFQAQNLRVYVEQRERERESRGRSCVSAHAFILSDPRDAH